MPGQHRPELSVTQLIAGAGATVTATVAASYFGVGGTLIGAGAVSVLSTIGATFYQHFLDRGKEQIAAKIPVRAGAGDGDEAPSGPPPGPVRPAKRPGPKWYVLCGAAGGVFLAVMGIVTAFELVTGRPLSNTLQGGSARGTSFHPVRGHARPAPTPPASGQATPTADATVTTTPSTRATPGRTPLTTPTPAASGLPLPLPGRRSAPAEGTGGPALPRSPEPQRLPDDENPWHTP
ncbi:MAG TPA: hypothetical protein VGD53_29170 [Actinoallomurus sp.]|jgi:hypothetical protein